MCLVSVSLFLFGYIWVCVRFIPFQNSNCLSTTTTILCLSFSSLLTKWRNERERMTRRRDIGGSGDGGRAQITMEHQGPVLSLSGEQWSSAFTITSRVLSLSLVLFSSRSFSLCTLSEPNMSQDLYYLIHTNSVCIVCIRHKAFSTHT